MRRNVDRLVRFHALNGAVSLAGNVVLVALLTGAAGMPVIGANLVAIASCSLLNFFASDLLVFKPAKIVAVALLGLPDGSSQRTGRCGGYPGAMWPSPS